MISCVRKGCVDEHPLARTLVHIPDAVQVPTDCGIIG
jgi:hypothetical protein